MRLAGALDRDALAAALGDLVARHESLRTIFPDTLGVPRQLILDASAARPRLAVTSVTEAGLAAALAAAAQHGFDLAGEPPLRAHLFALEPKEGGESEHVLLLLLHHIAGDGWSLAPLARDLAALLRGAQPGRRACSAGLAGAICRLHAVAARGAGPGGRCGRARSRASSRSGPRRSKVFPIRSICRATGRGRRWRAIAATACR